MTDFLNGPAAQSPGDTPAPVAVNPAPPTRRPAEPRCCASLYELPITSVLLGDSFHPGGLAVTRDLADTMLLGRGDKVLDVASGRGTSGLLLANSFGCDIVAIDLSRKNLRAVAGPPERRIDAVCASAEGLPLGDDLFDGVLCECALCTFSDRDAALREMFRVLKPGARVGISDMVLEAPVPDLLNGVLGHVICVAGAMSERDFLRRLQTAGFGSAQVRDRSASLLEMTDSIEKRLELAIAMGTDPELPDRFEETAPVLEAARDFVRSGGLRYALFTAKKPA